MPNLRIKNEFPNMRSRNEAPNLRVSSFQGGIATPEITRTASRKGMPIGLLLALTSDRARTATSAKIFFGEFRPNMRIANL